MTKRCTKGDRGAVAPVAALLLVIVLGAAAFVVDIGTQRVARADMQTLADVVAVDLSRELNGRTAAQLQPVIDTMATQSRDRNLDGVGGTPSIGVELGRIAESGEFEVVTGSTKVTAVRVTASTQVGFAMTSVTDSAETGSTTRRAIGTAATAACYKLGSWAAASSGSGDWTLVTPWLKLLAGQSGAFSNTNAVRSLSYHPLAAASVELAELATALGRTSTGALATSQIALKALLTALKDEAAPLSTANTTTMTTLINNASTTKMVDMAKVFAVDATFGVPSGATLNLLDAVGSAISQVDATAVPELGFGSGVVSGMSYGFIQSSMTDGPRQYCGYNGTTRLSSSAMAPKGTYSAGGLIGTSTSNALTVRDFGLTATSIFTGSASSYTKSVTGYGYVIADALTVGASSARLGTLSCTSNTASVEVTRGAATVGIKTKVIGSVKGTVKIGGRTYNGATVSIGALNNATNFDVVEGDAYQIPVTVAPASTVTRTVTPGAAPVPAGASVVSTGTAFYPPGHGVPPVTITYTSGGKQVAPSPAPTTAEKKLIYESVYQAAMQQMVDPTVANNFLTRYVEPMLALAGVSVGGVEVSVDSVPAMSCARPQLVG